MRVCCQKVSLEMLGESQVTDQMQPMYARKLLVQYRLVRSEVYALGTNVWNAFFHLDQLCGFSLLFSHVSPMIDLSEIGISS